MTDDITEEVTGEVNGEVAGDAGAARQAAAPAANAQALVSDPHLHSGVSAIGFGTLAKLQMPPRPFVSPPPRPPSKPRLQTVSHYLGKPGLKSKIRPGENARMFLPDFADTELGPSAPPTARATPRSLPGAISIPKGPKLPADVAAASIIPPREAPNRTVQRVPEPNDLDERDQTHNYSAEVIAELLQNCNETAGKAETSAADGDTRVGAIPIDEVICAHQPQSNRGVGHEDVTHLYNLSAAGPKLEDTAPGGRSKITEVVTEPRVIIRPESPKFQLVRWAYLSFFIAATAVGWHYRAPVERRIWRLHSSLMRGLEAVKKDNAAGQVSAPAPMVTLSVSVSPADARLVLDGAPVTNPCVIQRRSDQHSHSLVADAPGHMALQRSLVFDRDLTVVLALAPLAIAPTSTEEMRSISAATVPGAAGKAGSQSRNGTRARKTATTTKSERPVSNCSPPFTIDGSGIKTFKPECL